MSWVGLQVRRFAALVLICTACACTPLFENHGYAPADTDLDAVVVGQTTREELPDLIGRPASSGVLSESGWYYVQSRWRTYAFKAPVEIDRQVIAISFSDSGTVSNVERFGLQDGKVVALSRRITESNIKGISLIRQLLGNFGRLSAEQVVN
jgi:outer membrane protein assembly factor BamE (lipoprotein component of BamABCDE complex)